MESQAPTEKFPTVDLQELREGLLQNGLDAWQAADMIHGFLAGRGYGVTRESAREAVGRLESHSIDRIRDELEKLALIM